MSEVTLSLNERGEVLDKDGNALLRLAGFRFRPPSESEFKRIELRDGRMWCNGEDLGELGSVDLDVTDERDFVTVRLPVT
jgi:hypothetical protein